jgi:hypothetical protein
MRYMPMLRPLTALIALSALLAAPVAQAAASAQTLTPLNTSVLGGTAQEYRVRFFNALNQPAVGEAVTFANDVCGTFDNGGFVQTVYTDVSGVATAVFHAFSQGITCWITATAGVSVRFNVFTYTRAQVAVDGEASPSEPRPGQDFTFTATPVQGVYPIYEADVTAKVVPITISATITPASGNTGQSGHVDFEVTPEDKPGSYAIEVTAAGVTQRWVFASSAPYQDMWWSGPSQNGWGMSIVQHRDMLFTVIYAYDAAGKPTWYVMSGGTWNEAKTAFTGPLYLPSGSPYGAYDASRFNVNESVGSATITFSGTGKATVDYVINGITGRKSISRQLFGQEIAGAPLHGLGDMWWGGSTQNGWGIALLQQYKALFCVWFTYDAAGKPTWFVMPAGAWTSSDTYEGKLYRTAGSPWLGQPYDPALFRINEVGAYRFRFQGDTATFDYSIDGVAGTMPLVRQPF